MTPEEIKVEIENLRYMAEGLSYEHQIETRLTLLRKADIIEQINKEAEK